MILFSFLGCAFTKCYRDSWKGKDACHDYLGSSYKFTGSYTTATCEWRVKGNDDFKATCCKEKTQDFKALWIGWSIIVQNKFKNIVQINKLLEQVSVCCFWKWSNCFSGIVPNALKTCQLKINLVTIYLERWAWWNHGKKRIQPVPIYSSGNV